MLSKGGFVRSAKGHEIDPRTLQYKTGDEYQHAAKGRSVQQAVFLDSTGRAYSLVAHSLPSARGLGEPLSSRVDPPDGAKWRGVMIGEPEDLWLVASDAGYGFTVRLKEAYASKKAGKTLLNIPDGALVLPPAPVPGDDALVAVTSEGGKLLVFPVKDVPELPRGKGNKLFDIRVEEVRVARGLPHRHGRGGQGQVADRALGRAQDDHRVEGPQGLPRRARAARLGAAARLAQRRLARDRVTQ